jgi:hypothetical protein
MRKFVSIIKGRPSKQQLFEELGGGTGWRARQRGKAVLGLQDELARKAGMRKQEAEDERRFLPVIKGHYGEQQLQQDLGGGLRARRRANDVLALQDEIARKARRRK